MRFDYPPGATPIDPDEAAGLIPSSVETLSDLNVFESENIAEARLWAFAQRPFDPLDDLFLRGLHRRMFNRVWRWAGAYRRSNKNLGVDWRQLAPQVRNLCEDTRVWIEHRAFDWTELGARFHHRLVSIHPFINGNGRHARLMTDVLLATHQQSPLTWGAGRNLAAAGPLRAEYIAALRAADGGEFTQLLAFVRS
jgi:Fic-DOC domain mobile mystery protein B